MRTTTTDVAIIGAGTAGLAAYRAVKAAGRRALLIEQGPHGTTCARVGCMPSKLLIAAAEAAHHARHAGGFGIRIDGGITVDGRAVMERVRRERDRFVGFVLEDVAAMPAKDKLSGRARFVAPQLLEVDGRRRVRCGAVVIATGARARVPDMLHGLGERLVINDDVFGWHDLPRRLAVLGPGIIGLELGQALARLGVAVRVFGRSGSLGALTDTAVRDYARLQFQREFALEPQVDVERVTREGPEVVIRYRGTDGALQAACFDSVLAATGRRQNVDDLGLQHSGLALDAHGVPEFDPASLQCGSAPVFIAGDVNGRHPLLHEAADNGRIAGENAARWPAVSHARRRTPLTVVFTEPQIALVGKRYADLPAGSFVTGRVSFENQGRSRIMRVNRGLLHIYAARDSGRLLGAEGIGPRLEHLAHLLAWSCQQSLTVNEMLAMPFYHPVIEEGLRSALRDAASALKS
jgi:dihydrolipoamide dehydrogenase